MKHLSVAILLLIAGIYTACAWPFHGWSGWTSLSPVVGTGTCTTSGSTYTGSCIVYVADAAHGGTVGASCVAAPPINQNFPTPCLGDTMAHMGAAYNYLRNNSSDWMLFAAGSVFTVPLGNTSGFASGLNGASPSAPIVFSMYGSGGTACHDTRPCFKTAALYGFEAFNSNYGKNLALVSLEFYDSVQDPSSADYTAPIAAGTPGGTCGNSGTSCVYTGTSIPASLTAAGAMSVFDLTQNIALPGHISSASGTTITMSSALTSTINSGDLLAFWSNNPQGIYVVGATYILIEDCLISFYGVNIALENTTAGNTTPYDIHIRRNEILDAYGFTTHGIGLFIADNANPGGTIEIYQNVIDHNGFNNGAAFNWVNQVVGAGATIFNQGVYIHDVNPPVTMIGNVLSNAAATGAEVRSGGTVYNNLCVGDPICLAIYTGFQTNTNVTSYNVITDATDIQYGSMITSGTSTSTTLNFTTVLPNGIAANTGLFVIDLTNPSAIPASTYDTVASAGATSVTLNQAATAVASGDQILFFSPRGQGIFYNYCGGYGLSVAATTGATTLKFASLGPGVASGQSVLVGGAIPASTTISTITVVSGTETDVAINNPITANISTYASGGPPIQFYTSPVSSPADAFCSSTTGPNNIYSRQNQFNAINSQALYFPAGTYYFNYGGDYFIGISTFAGYPNAGFNWGVSGAGTQYVDQGTNNNDTGEHANYTPSGTPTIEAYDTSIGGPGTAADFIAGARALSKANWNTAYIASAANNWIRGQVSSGIPTQPLN